MKKLSLEVITLFILGASSFTAQASCIYFDEFRENGDGTITDPRNGLTWQKCVIGQTWSGSACQGKPTPMFWDNAMQAARENRFLSQSDWRLPTLDEFRSILGDDGECAYENSAVSRKLWYPAKKSEDGDQDFWSSSKQGGIYAWLVDFHNGGFGGDFVNYMRGVRLVRSGNTNSTPQDSSTPIPDRSCIYKDVMTDDEMERCKNR